MLLFGRVPCNLHGCEKHQPESNKDSIPYYLSDSQRHSAPVYRGNRKGAQGAEPDVHPEEPCRGNALLPGVEDRVAQLDLRRSGRERAALDVDGRNRAEAEHLLQCQRDAAVRDGKGPLLADVQLPHRHRPGFRARRAQGLLLPDQGVHVRRRLVHDQADHEQLRLGAAPTREGRRQAPPDARPRQQAPVLRHRGGRCAP